MFQWFVNTMTYYGLLFGAGELPGSGNRFKFIAYRTGAVYKKQKNIMSGNLGNDGDDSLNHIIRPTSETWNRL